MEKKKLLKFLLILVAIVVGGAILVSPYFAISYFLGAKFGLIETNFVGGDIALFYAVAFLILYFDWLFYRKCVKGH